MAKRLFDIFLALAGLLFFGWIILFFAFVILITTGKSGFFAQTRIGQYGRKFTIFKLRSMNDVNGEKVVTKPGRFIRKYKIDELPQLYNILNGTMSIVGPRPDLPGYYDLLTGADRELLKLKPGLTGPASLKYANEEELLATVKDPVWYNDNVIFPDKVRINLNYQQHRSLLLDLKLIMYTIIGKKPNEEYFQ